MKRRAIILAMFLGYAGCTPDEPIRPEAVASDESDDGVRLAIKSLLGAALSQNQQRIQDLVTNDVLLVGPMGARWDGPFYASALFVSFFADGQCRGDVQVEGIDISGSLAFEFGRATICRRGRGGDLAELDSVFYTRVWTKRDGTWRVRSFTWTDWFKERAYW